MYTKLFFSKYGTFTHEPLLLVFCDADSQGEADPRGASCDEDHLLAHCARSVFVSQIQRAKRRKQKMCGSRARGTTWRHFYIPLPNPQVCNSAEALCTWATDYHPAWPTHGAAVWWGFRLMITSLLSQWIVRREKYVQPTRDSFQKRSLLLKPCVSQSKFVFATLEAKRSIYVITYILLSQIKHLWGLKSPISLMLIILWSPVINAG